MRAEDLIRSRATLLYDLNLAVDEAEELAQTLLFKPFDLDLYEEPCVPLPTALDELSCCDHANDMDELYSASFLSTPLRTKYFSRLSPSTLRGLLRSPSVRDFDDSAESIPPSDLLMSSPNQSDESCSVVLPISDSSLPLTPPPTTRVPFSELLPPTDLVDVGHLQDITDSVRKAANFSNTRLAAANHLVSPAAVRHFQRVIDEMKGVDHIKKPTFTFESRSTNSVFEDPSAMSRSSTPATNHTPSVLEEEFISLLEQRAIDEEADAEELREVANRLDTLARARRRLITLIIEKNIDIL